MNILVCIKQVPDTTEIRMDPKTNTLIRAGVPSTVNPFDKYALEAAVQLRETLGGTVTAMTMGPAQAAQALRECYALGADRMVLVSDRRFGGADTYATSYTLAQQRQQLVPPLAEQKLLPDRVIVPVLKEDEHAVLILHHAIIGHVAPRAQLQHHVPCLRGGRLLVELDIAETEVARLRQAQAARTVAHQLRILLPIAQEIMDHLLALRHALAVKARLAEVMVELLGKAAEQLLIHHRRQPAREIATGKGIKHPVGNVGAQDHGVVADIRRHRQHRTQVPVTDFKIAGLRHELQRVLVVIALLEHLIDIDIARPALARGADDVIRRVDDDDRRVRDHLPPDLHQRLQPGVRAHGQTHLILQCLQAVKQCEQVVRHRAERILFVIQQRIDTGANGLRILRARPDNEKVVVQQPLR